MTQSLPELMAELGTHLQSDTGPYGSNHCPRCREIIREMYPLIGQRFQVREAAEVGHVADLPNQFAAVKSEADLRTAFAATASVSTRNAAALLLGEGVEVPQRFRTIAAFPRVHFPNGPADMKALQDFMNRQSELSGDERIRKQAFCAACACRDFGYNRL